MFPNIEQSFILVAVLVVHEKNTGEKHVEGILGEVSGFEAVFEDMV
jgi:hypothetical protein